MTDKQRLELRNSEIRSRLATLGAEDATEGGKTEIDTLAVEYSANETRIRAFMVAGDSPVETTTSKEGQERAELYQSASVGDLVYALVNGRSGVDGSQRELQQELGLASNEIHIRQLAPESYGATPSPTNVGETMDPIIPYIFPSSISSTFLGIYQPTVPVGDAVFNVLTKALDVRTPAEGGSAAETTGTWTSESLSPARLQAAYIFQSREQGQGNGPRCGTKREPVYGSHGRTGCRGHFAGTNNGLLTGTTLRQSQRDHANDLRVVSVSQLAYGRVDGRFAIL